MIDLPGQPHDGRPRRCYKCKALFKPCIDFPNARQCRRCRQGAPLPFRPSERVERDHSRVWERRSLGRVEADFLRHAWGPRGPGFVTRNSEES